MNAELRCMPEIQEIAAYLRGMKFDRKLFGGSDMESVLNHFSEVTLKYEAIISSLLAQLEEEKAAYEQLCWDINALLAEREQREWVGLYAPQYV